MWRNNLRIAPCSLAKANDFVEAYHRHSLRTSRNGGKFAIAAAVGAEVMAVAIVGNPLSATLMDGFTAEVLRSCSRPEAPRNCNSILYGACRRIWFQMGGSRIITYTLTEETGASLRGAGWTLADTVKGHNPKTWGKKDHLERTEQALIAKGKRRWESINPKYFDNSFDPLMWPAKPEEVLQDDLFKSAECEIRA